MKPITDNMKPIARIGLEKTEPIKPITNLLHPLRAIGLEAQVVGNIYTYKKNNNLLHLLYPPPSRNRNKGIFARTRTRGCNRLIGCPTHIGTVPTIILFLNMETSS